MRAMRASTIPTQASASSSWRRSDASFDSRGRCALRHFRFELPQLLTGNAEVDAPALSVQTRNEIAVGRVELRHFHTETRIVHVADVVFGRGFGLGDCLVQAGAGALSSRATLDQVTFRRARIETHERRSRLDALADRCHPGNTQILCKRRIDRNGPVCLHLASRPDDRHELARAHWCERQHGPFDRMELNGPDPHGNEY
jgi:hypothetical protein